MDPFRTSNLPLATCLSLYYPVSTIDRSEPRAVFYFERGEGMDDLVQMFHARTMAVEPQAYADAMRSLKARLYAREDP